MNCLECGAKLEITREPHRYEACGLKGVTLCNIEVRRCPNCGEEEIVIPAVAQLHGALARQILARDTRLNGDEVRFLRKYVGWSGVDFARHMGVDRATVSRWENGSNQMGPIADRLLRLYVATVKQIEDYSVDSLANISDDAPPSQTRIRMSRRDDANWQPESVCL